MLLYRIIESPVGPLILAGDDSALACLWFAAGKSPAEPRPEWRPGAPVPVREAERQLAAYYAGRMRDIDLPLAPSGTPFQLRVWEELRRIPYGETISYGDLARRIGQPTASRAVGLANGSNPIAIVIPCHRVIGANGKLTGYGGGLPIKEHLLSLEGALPCALAAPEPSQPALFAGV